MGGGGWGGDGGEGRLYLTLHVTTRIAPALRRAAKTAINCEGQSHKDTVHKSQLLKTLLDAFPFSSCSSCGQTSCGQTRVVDPSVDSVAGIPF